MRLKVLNVIIIYTLKTLLTENLVTSNRTNKSKILQ